MALAPRHLGYYVAATTCTSSASTWRYPGGVVKRSKARTTQSPTMKQNVMVPRLKITILLWESLRRRILQNLIFYPHRAVEVPWAFTNVAQLGTRIAKMKKSKFRWNCGEFTTFFAKTYICFKSSLFCNCLLVSFSLYLFFSQRALLEPGLKLVITLH